MEEQHLEFSREPAGPSGEERRRTEFDSNEEELEYNASNLIELAKKLFQKEHVTVQEVLDLATRKHDNIVELRRVIAILIKGGTIIKPVMKTEIYDAENQPDCPLSPEQVDQLIDKIKPRFESHSKNRRHLLYIKSRLPFHRWETFHDIPWEKVEEKLREAQEKCPEKLWSLNEMERTGGEPDVLYYHEETDELEFADCSLKNPPGRKNLCLNRKDQEIAERSGYKPSGNAEDMVSAMGWGGIITYQHLKDICFLNTGESSWRHTKPEDFEGDFNWLSKSNFKIYLGHIPVKLKRSLTEGYELLERNPFCLLPKMSFRAWIRI